MGFDCLLKRGIDAISAIDRWMDADLLSSSLLLPLVIISFAAVLSLLVLVAVVSEAINPEL